MHITRKRKRVRKAMENFQLVTSPKKSRKTLMKIFFSAPQQELSRTDKEEVYFLYNLLEDLE